MKKIIIGITVILALGLVGCSEEKGSNDAKNDIKTMSTSKAEKLDKLEYASRFKKLSDDNFTGTEHEEKYSDSKLEVEKESGADRDIYKNLAEGLSTFKSEDEGINQLHDKVIELSTDVYTMANERIELGREGEKLKSKEGDLTEKEKHRLDEITDKISLLQDMIDNQKEQVSYIGKEIGGILGID